MAGTQTFLVVGATGTQGGSVVKALLKDSDAKNTPIKILALTRNAASARSKPWAQDGRVQLLQGDPNSPDQIFKDANTPIDGVFCVTVHGPAGSEEAQAQGLIDASLLNGVQHFVFTSADRGGEVVSNTNPTPVAHIATKHHIEKYLKDKTQNTSMSWTILRPVTFMDNLTPDFAGKGFAAMWRQVGQKPIQLVAASDIGAFASKALMNRAKYASRQIGIAGDELNYEQATKVFRDTMGVEMPTTFCAVGTIAKIAMRDIGSMFKWFEKDGYNVDIKVAREEYPDLLDFAGWLKTSSGFREVKN